jgi:hypothetical protein
MRRQSSCPGVAPCSVVPNLDGLEIMLKVGITEGAVGDLSVPVGVEP